MRRTIVAVLGALMLVAVPALAADIEIIPINESLLPPSLSPMSYNNSPINYQNSIYNYKNSSLNYTNSSMNYVNSPANVLTAVTATDVITSGRKATVRRILRLGRQLMNFFSPSGTRMFTLLLGLARFDGHRAFVGSITSTVWRLLLPKGQAVMRDEGVPP